MKQKIFSLVIIFLTFLVVTLTIPKQIIKKNQQDATNNKLLANHIYDEIKANIDKTITISRTIAADTMLKDYLQKEDSYSEEEMEQILSEYLSSIRDKFGYKAAYIISENSHRYYSPKGIMKIVSPGIDPYDIWYELFINSRKELDLDADRDDANDYKWTVFVNARLTDSEGKLLGVCGVGVFMDDLQEIISEIESHYFFKINLINQSGLVQVDSDYTNIENVYISDALNDRATEDDFTFTKKSHGGFRLTRYMPESQWYLVVQSFYQQKNSDGLTFMLVCVYIFLIILAVAIMWPKKHEDHDIIIKNDINEDPLTKLPNRNYLIDSFGELGIFNTTRYKSLAMFDIDRFKAINETENGDKIILGVTNYAKQIIEEKGILFRWSGDEFVAFLEMDSEQAEEKFREFCKNVSKNLEVTISVGIVDISLSDSIKTNYHRAVQLCYAQKEKGGNGVKRQK